MLITVFGRRGSGKTTLIRRLIPTQKRPIIVIDVLGNFVNDGWDVAYSLKSGLESLAAYLRDKENHSGTIVVVDSDINRTIDYFCSALWKIGGGTLVLDEVDAFSIAESPCFDEAIRYGRNRGIDVITGCRRPAELSRNITAGADIAFIFNTHEPRDILYYSEFVGDELALTLRRLPQYHGIFKDFKNQKSGIFKTTGDGKITILRNAKQSLKKPDQIPLDFDDDDTDSDKQTATPSEQPLDQSESES